MDTYFCRATVSVFDPKTKHSYNEEDVKRYVEAPTAEEAMEIFRQTQSRSRFPIAPAVVLVKFQNVDQRYKGENVGVIAYQRRRK
jgi:hypothetical protein